MLTKHSSPIRKHFDKARTIFSNNFSLFAEELCDKHQVTQLFMFLEPNETVFIMFNAMEKVNLHKAWRFYRPQTKLWEDNVFTGVCLSTVGVCIPVCNWAGWCVSQHAIGQMSDWGKHALPGQRHTPQTRGSH